MKGGAYIPEYMHVYIYSVELLSEIRVCHVSKRGLF